jgi:solute carrier family 13 (sodium-dependent dicarboxylate transporter), member 2/3/5
MNISPAEELFETWRKRVGLVAAPVLFAVTWWLTGGLTPEGRKLAAILAAVAVLWVTETLPLPVTALLGAVLCVAFGVAPARQVLGYFADPIVFVFIGSFMLARAMSVHHLDRRIALGFLSMRWIGGRPALVLAGMGLITAIISMWVSNTATTAMMLPIGLGILGAMHRGNGPIDARSWPFATGMMLMIAYAASIGGIGTPVGSPPNLIGVGLISRATGREIGFFTWMLLCVPMLAAMGVVLFVLLYRLHPSNTPTSDPDSMHRYIRDERAKLGPWSWGQLNTLIAFGVAVFLWIAPGLLVPSIWGDDPTSWPIVAGKWMKSRLDEPIAALIAAVLLFALPTSVREGRFTLTWDDAVRIDWGTILLFGGGLALGTLMIETKVAEALGRSLTAHLGVSSIWALTGMSIALGIVLSEATSNTAASNMIIPVVIGICKTAEISPIPPALGACLGASYGFMLPVSTPPNAIVYGSGLVSIPSMIRAGILFDILGFFIIWAGLRLLCPLLGLM